MDPLYPMEKSPIRGSAGQSPQIPQDGLIPALSSSLPRKPELDYMSLFALFHLNLPQPRCEYGLFPFAEFFSQSVDEAVPKETCQNGSVFTGGYQVVDLNAEKVPLSKVSMPYRVNGVNYRHREVFFVNSKRWRLNCQLTNPSQSTLNYMHGMLKSYSIWENNLSWWTDVTIFRTNNPLILVFILKLKEYVHRGYIIFNGENPAIVPKVNFQSNQGFCPTSKVTNLVEQVDWSTKKPFHIFLNTLLAKQKTHDKILNRRLTPEVRATPLGRLVIEQALILSAMIRKSVNKKSLNCFKNGTIGSIAEASVSIVRSADRQFSNGTLETTFGYDKHMSTRKRPSTEYYQTACSDVTTRDSYPQQHPSGTPLPPIETFSQSPMEIQYLHSEQPGQQAESSSNAQEFTLSESMIFPELHTFEEQRGQQVGMESKGQPQMVHPSLQHFPSQVTFPPGHPTNFHQSTPHAFSMGPNQYCSGEQQHSMSQIPNMHMDIGPSLVHQFFSYPEMANASPSMLNFCRENQQRGHSMSSGYPMSSQMQANQPNPQYYNNFQCHQTPTV